MPRINTMLHGSPAVSIHNRRIIWKSERDHFPLPLSRPFYLKRQLRAQIMVHAHTHTHTHDIRGHSNSSPESSEWGESWKVLPCIRVSLFCPTLMVGDWSAPMKNAPTRPRAGHLNGYFLFALFGGRSLILIPTLKRKGTRAIPRRLENLTKGTNDRTRDAFTPRLF